MQWIWPVLVAGGLGLLAWPVVEAPSEPALEFVAQSNTDRPGQRVEQRASWSGDEKRRNAILLSAVWSGR